MGLQEELQALAAQNQNRAFDPFEEVIGQFSQAVQQPQQQEEPGYLAQIKEMLGMNLSPEGQGRFQESLARPYSQVQQEEGILGSFSQFANRNPIPNSMEMMEGLKSFLVGSGPQSPSQQAPSSTTRLPQEQSLREADPIAQIQQALYSPNGGDLGGAGRGFSKGAEGSSDLAADRYRSVIRDAAVQKAGQGTPLTDEERVGRKMEDVIIGTPRDPGLVGGVAGQDPEVRMQLVNSVRKITGLGPVEAEDLVDNSEGMSGGEMLGLLIGGGATLLGGKRLMKGRAKPKLKTSEGSFPKGPRTGKTRAPSADDLVNKMKGSKATPEVGSFKTGSANKAGGYQGTREVGMPERGFQMREGGSSSKAPSGADIRASRKGGEAPKQKALPDNSTKEQIRLLDTGKTYPITKAERGFKLGDSKSSGTTREQALKDRERGRVTDWMAERESKRNSQKALPAGTVPKGLPAGEVPKRLEYLLDKKKLTPEERADLKDMLKGVFKQTR